MGQYNFELENDGANGKKKKVVLERQRFHVEIVPLLLCLFLALVIWIVIYNLNDESVTQVYTVPLTIEGKESLLENDLSLYNTDEDIKVQIEIKGTNRDIRRCKAEDFRVVANVGEIKEAGGQTVTLSVTMPSGMNSLSCVSTDPPTITVFADVYMEKEVPFDIMMGYMSADASYEIGAPVSNISSFRIAGPSMVIRDIERAAYTVTPDKVTGSIRLTGITPMFYSKTGDIVTIGNDVAYTPLDEDGKPVAISDITITLEVTTSKKVPIRLVYDDKKFDAHIVGDVTTVTLRGDPKLLENISEYTVELINKAGRQQVLLVGDADVEDKLPKGVSILENRTTIAVEVTAAASD